MSRRTEILVDHLIFAEGPRWHADRLWFSDMHAHWVMKVDLAGTLERVVEVPGCPSGLGWLPDGGLLVVSMTDRRLLRLDASGLSEVADLSGLASFHLNDMVVDTQGRAYIGNFGFDFQNREPPRPAELVLVEPGGQARVVARDMLFPNGSVLTPDGRTLIVAESFSARLTAFDVAADGTLSGRRLWADLERVAPDGICLDQEGAIWVAAPLGNEVLRVHEGGRVSDRFPVDRMAIACMLGGHDRRTLFVLTAESTHPDEVKAKASARIEVVEVEVPGAGLP